MKILFLSYMLDDCNVYKTEAVEQCRRPNYGTPLLFLLGSEKNIQCQGKLVTSFYVLVRSHPFSVYPKSFWEVYAQVTSMNSSCSTCSIRTINLSTFCWVHSEMSTLAFLTCSVSGLLYFSLCFHLSGLFWQLLSLLCCLGSLQSHRQSDLVCQPMFWACDSKVCCCCHQSSVISLAYVCFNSLAQQHNFIPVSAQNLGITSRRIVKILDFGSANRVTDVQCHGCGK